MTAAVIPPRSWCSPGLRKAVVRLGLATPALLAELDTAVANCKILNTLRNHHGLNEEQALAALVRDLNIPHVDLSPSKVFDRIRRSGLSTQVRADLLLGYRCVPLWAEQQAIAVAFADPLDREAVQQLEFALGAKVEICLASEDHILAALERLLNYGAAQELETPEPVAAGSATDVDLLAGTLVNARSEEEGSAAAPVITFVNQVLSDAYDAKASDIHLEPSQTAMEVRYRIDGVMLHQLSVPKRLQPYITTRLKILAGADITEKRRPQDGRFRMRMRNGSAVDVRASTVPTPFGEKLVLRLLRSSIDELRLKSLRMDQAMQQRFHDVLRSRDRMVLVTGPTGSGKTTTLYSAINDIRDGANNIITVEDPIEIRLEGITQIQVDQKLGVTFASGLRSILRQDPDIILVGEIRDLETAEIAAQAAQTGHLVLSTLHANSAAATVIRLTDLGLQPFTVAASLGAVMAQRLIRTLCENCRIADTSEEARAKARQLGIAPEQLQRPVGCAACDQTGYRGRVGVYSLLLVDGEIRDCIRRGADEAEIEQCARRNGMVSLSESALRFVAEGVSSFDEVERVIGIVSPSPRPAPSPAASERRPSPAAAVAPSDERTSIEWLASKYREESSHIARQQRVLFVDDDEGIRAVVSRVLRMANFEVCEAANGFDALDKLASFAPDLIVSDLVMPGMDGRELVQELQRDAATATIPILVLTGSDAEENEIELISLGATDFVSKGSSPALLLARIKRLLRV